VLGERQRRLAPQQLQASESGRASCPLCLLSHFLRRNEPDGSFRWIGRNRCANALYDANNKLTSFNGTAYTYDNNGSLIGDGTKTYLWDLRNRLSQIKQGASVVASFQYDSLDRRISKTVGALTTQYLHDGANAVQELTASNVVTANVVAGAGMDQWLFRTEGATTRYFLTDALNSTRALTDDAKTIQTRYQYEPYGETTATGAASNNTSQYTGRENDATGLYYYRARYYHPIAKRFISEDPIGLAGGVNAYAYVEGNPVSFADPLGEFLNLPGMGVAAGINLFSQLVEQSGEFRCVNLGELGLAAATGAVFPGFGRLASGYITSLIESMTPFAPGAPGVSYGLIGGVVGGVATRVIGGRLIDGPRVGDLTGEGRCGCK
jgi:RHS repeat-associated protein